MSELSAADIRAKIERERVQQQAARGPYLAAWRDLTDFISPWSSAFFADTKRAKNHALKILNPMAVIARERLVSGLQAGMANPSRPWFKIRLQDAELHQSTAVKQWLYDVEGVLREIIASSNIYNTLPNVYDAMITYGIGALLLLEDRDTVARAYSFPVGSFSVGADQRGRVCWLISQETMTVFQVVSEFGLDAVSTRVKGLWDKGQYEDKVEIVHSIGPSPWRDETKLSSWHKPYHSIYYELGDKDTSSLLRQEGFDEFPVMVPRWSCFGRDLYGYGPGMVALGAVKQLQQMTLQGLDVTEALVNPSLVADSVLLARGGASRRPGETTYVDGLGSMQHAAIRPLMPAHTDASWFETFYRRSEEVINRAFLTDVLMMLTTTGTSGMTVPEIEARNSEKLMVLGPMLERCNEELFDPLIYRVFNLALRNGKIPLPPEELHGQSWSIEYTSIMAQAQKTIGINGIHQLTAYVGNVATFQPNILDRFDGDSALEEVSTMLGTPPKLVRSDEDTDAIRQARAQQQQEQQLMQMAPATAQAATAAKTLSDTQIGSSTALNQLLGY